jgi:hypothetical protein
MYFGISVCDVYYLILGYFHNFKKNCTISPSPSTQKPLSSVSMDLPMRHFISPAWGNLRLGGCDFCNEGIIFKFFGMHENSKLCVCFHFLFWFTLFYHFYLKTYIFLCFSLYISDRIQLWFLRSLLLFFWHWFL